MTKQSWYWVDSFCILMSEIWVSNLFILFNLLTFIIPPRVLKILYQSDELIFFYSLLFSKKVQCKTFSSLYLSLMLLEITCYCDLFICTTFFEAITVYRVKRTLYSHSLFLKFRNRTLVGLFIQTEKLFFRVFFNVNKQMAAYFPMCNHYIIC